MVTESENQGGEQNTQENSQVQQDKPKNDIGADDISSLKKSLEDAVSKAQDSYENMLRAKADAENARRIAKTEVEKAKKYGVERFAKEILNVLDSLELGLKIDVGDNEQVKAMREGMELTYKMVLDILDKFGIKLVNPMGESFNPALHEALSMQATDEVAPNKVLTVVQPGFIIYDRVLRPARVIVSRANEQQEKQTKEKA